MLEGIPAIVRVLMVFVLVLIAIRKNLSLGNAFLLGAIALGFIFGLRPLAMVRSILTSVAYTKTLSLAMIVSLILVLSHSMELAGQLQRLVSSFRGLVRTPRLNIIVFPALIGLLPMPGGAVFSAPMVKTLGSRLELSGTELSYINYWFRHIWEYWWPLYPGVLLTITLAELDLSIFVLFLCPLTVVAWYAGYLPLKGLKDVGDGATSNLMGENRPPLGPFLKELTPILITICLGLGLGTVISLAVQSGSLVGTVAKEIGLISALLIAIVWVWHRNRLSAAQRWQAFTNRELLRLVYMVMAILAFKGILEDSRAVQSISQELLHWHVPLMPITVVLPFLVGSVVGVTIGFVGTTFPILIALIKSFSESQFMLGYMMLGLTSGFAGVLFSPLHICLLLSNQYFGATLGGVYRYLWLPGISLVFIAIGYFWILHFINPF